jgi:hypothetical protein
MWISVCPEIAPPQLDIIPSAVDKGKMPAFFLKQFLTAKIYGF